MSAETTRKKSPWFALYPDDFLGSIAEMDNDTLGFYFRLLLHQATNDSIPDPTKDERAFCRAGGCFPGEWQELWENVGHKFNKCEDGRLRNARMEREQAVRNGIRDARIEAGKKGGEANGKQNGSKQGSKSPSKTKANTEASTSTSTSPSLSPTTKQGGAGSDEIRSDGNYSGLPEEVASIAEKVDSLSDSWIRTPREWTESYGLQQAIYSRRGSFQDLANEDWLILRWFQLQAEADPQIKVTGRRLNFVEDISSHVSRSRVAWTAAGKPTLNKITKAS